MEKHDEREQLESMVHLLMRVRTGLEKIEPDGDGPTAYMHARNARIDLNEAVRRLRYLLDRSDLYPAAPETDTQQ